MKHVDLSLNHFVDVERGLIYIYIFIFILFRFTLFFSFIFVCIILVVPYFVSLLLLLLGVSFLSGNVTFPLWVIIFSLSRCGGSSLDILVYS